MTWNKIEVPSGNFIGWGRIGQQVTLHVIAYEAEGGRDFNGQACPQLVGKLTAPTDSHRKDGPPQNYQIGDIVTVTCGQANLRRGIQIANPASGDYVRLTYTGNYSGPNGEGKIIEVEHAPGSTPPTGAVSPDSL
jgi:hypothetical protein